MRRTSRSSCSFSVVVFLPTMLCPAVYSGLCLLFSFPVRSLGLSLLGFLLFCFFLFCAFGCLRFDCPASSFLPLGAFPVLLKFRTSSSASASFSYLSLLLFSTGSLSSSSCFCIGCPGVRFCSWGCYFSCSSGPGSAFSFVLLFLLRVFHMMRFPLLLAVFLCVFLHAVATAGSSGLPPHSHVLRLWLHLPVFLSVSACCSSSCSFHSSFLFSACCNSSCSFHFWCSSCILPC